MADRTYELRLFDRHLMSFRFDSFGDVEVISYDEGARDLHLRGFAGAGLLGDWL